MNSVVGWGQNPLVDAFVFSLTQKHCDSCMELFVKPEPCYARVIVFTSRADIDEYLVCVSSKVARVACSLPVFVLHCGYDDVDGLVTYGAEHGISITACFLKLTEGEVNVLDSDLDELYIHSVGLIEEHIDIDEVFDSAQFWEKRAGFLIDDCKAYYSLRGYELFKVVFDEACLLEATQSESSRDFWRSKTLALSESIGRAVGIDVGDLDGNLLFKCPVSNARSLISFIGFGSSYC